MVLILVIFVIVLFIVIFLFFVFWSGVVSEFIFKFQFFECGVMIEFDVIVFVDVDDFDFYFVVYLIYF